ncbi:hypothetical protein SISNIDRAFT_222948 [Sistotremastrum niveocremeum HHB9708]|uniref:Zn(2)-C6 fungal-type domain-containing protein n=2 Tax=Sistotremastraceae TaxID=3402574 RepID=A0A164QEG9_9AGAM|nr:hypothetical protein SISNIDRAFT_222948 [Sistotremastrum niveocremeum HHB9708]KZT40817.1 hypothetical protein SISSUDRAFT_430134 [Sistotremastrum suecicum HHB10207 ss-3]
MGLCELALLPLSKLHTHQDLLNQDQNVPIATSLNIFHFRAARIYRSFSDRPPIPPTTIALTESTRASRRSTLASFSRASHPTCNVLISMSSILTSPPQKKASMACFPCSQAKRRCDQGTPCQRCLEKDKECAYPAKQRFRGKGRNPRKQREGYQTKESTLCDISQVPSSALSESSRAPLALPQKSNVELPSIRVLFPNIDFAPRNQ